MEELRLIIDFIVFPLFLWIWYTDRKIVRIEAQQVTSADLEKIYKELKEIRKEVHEKK